METCREDRVGRERTAWRLEVDDGRGFVGDGAVPLLGDKGLTESVLPRACLTPGLYSDLEF